jgi:CPA2 family monovalent cation:H+ antiporter-2
MHEMPLPLATLVIGLTLAFVFGFAARLLRLPPLLGYILAGLAIGPHTPGFVADPGMTAAMAEIGVALLLFGVGLHFRARDLLAVWRVAVPGAMAQIIAGTVLGGTLGHFAFDLALGPALVFGLALAISSTAVATRVLEERGRLAGEAGRLALGWLVVQDLVVVLALVLVPALGSSAPQAEGLGIVLLRTAGELVAFLVAIGLVGRVLLPRLIGLVASTGSRELFTLAVVMAALGTAFGSAMLFGVSPALGAFFAGVLLAESHLGHQAAADTGPLQRVFVALFFVSVGMMVDPLAVIAAPFLVIATLAAVLLGTGVAMLLLLTALRVNLPTAATVAGSMAQIGEFSFVLQELAIRQGILPPEVRAPILAAAVCTIVATPLSLSLADRLARWLTGQGRFRAWEARRGGARAWPALPPGLRDHVIVVGYGRVGRLVGAALSAHGLPHVAIEADHRLAEAIRAEGIPVVWGDATRPEVMHAARPEQARLIILATPDVAGGPRALQLARAANAGILAAARAHDAQAAALLEGQDGMGLVVMGEREIALGIAAYSLKALGVPLAQADRTMEGLRRAG